MGDKILLVDDEPAFLTGYKLILPETWEADTAVGGERGLAAIRDHGPYAVVVSDMRMPGMNGVQFLAQVRQAAPDTVRIMLTGYSDVSAAMDAVNQGNIFRFLAKPCEQEVLSNAITSGLVLRTGGAAPGAGVTGAGPYFPAYQLRIATNELSAVPISSATEV